MKKIITSLLFLFCILTAFAGGNTVATVTNSEGTKEFETLESAIAAANSSQSMPTVKLLQSTMIFDALEATRSMTVDFNGQLIDGDLPVYFVVNGEEAKVTMLDSSQGEGGFDLLIMDQDDQSVAILKVLKGSLALQGVKVAAVNWSSTELSTIGVSVAENASFTMDGGLISVNADNHTIGVLGNKASVTINDGEIDPSSDSKLGYSYGILASNGTVTVNGGTIRSNGTYYGWGVYLYSYCKGEFNGGEFLPLNDSKSGRDFTVDSTSKLTINGGCFSSYTTDFSKYIPANKYLTPILDSEEHALFSRGCIYKITDRKASLGVARNLTTNKAYSSLEAAVKAARSGDTISLYENYTLSSNLTIPEGVVVIVPFDASNEIYTSNALSVPPTTYMHEYRTLTLANDVVLTVNGELNVSAHQNSSGGGGMMNAGGVGGNYGAVNALGGSSIVVNGTLCSWGYIYGEGTVTANSTARIYQGLAITDWRGGTITSNKLFGEVFPMNQFYIQNIEIPTTFLAGAQEFLSTSYSTTIGCLSPSDILWVGQDSAFINLEEGASLTRVYNPQTDRVTYDLSGNVTLGGITLFLEDGSMNSTAFEFAFNNNWDIIHDNGNLSLPYSYTMLPGTSLSVGLHSRLTIEEGATLYVYDTDGYSFSSLGYIMPLQFTHANGFNNRSIRIPSGNACGAETLQSLTDASINVQGLIDVKGNLLTSAGGANLYSSNKKGIIRYFCDQSEVKLKEMVDEFEPSTQNLTNTNLCNRSFTAASLTNSDGTLVATDNEVAGYNYKLSKGIWTKVLRSAVIGDVNDDEKLTIADVATLIEYLNGGTPKHFNSYSADYNGDLEITLKDVKSLVRKLQK